jgi:hypothetical protein
MISGREFVIPLPSSFRRIYWQYCSGSSRDPSPPMTKTQAPGERNLMTILPFYKSGIWRSQKWHRSHHGSEEMKLQAPTGGHVHDYHRIERVGCRGGGGGGGGGKSTPNGCRVALASASLWRYGSTHALPRPYMDVRSQLHTPQWLYPGEKRPW